MVAVRLSLTMPSPDLWTVRTGLKRLADEVAALGPGRGLIGAIDRRARRRDDHGPHVYALGLFSDLAEARRVRDWWATKYEAALDDRSLAKVGCLRPTSRASQCASAVGYMVRPWPRACGESRDPVLDCAASGSLATLWAAFGGDLVGSPEGPRCLECGRPLSQPKRTGRRAAFCTPARGLPACKSKFYRRSRAERDAKRASALSLRAISPTSTSGPGGLHDPGAGHAPGDVVSAAPSSAARAASPGTGGP